VPGWLSPIRHAVHSRSWFRERENSEPPRPSGIVLRLTLVMLAVGLLAKVITEIFSGS